MSTAKLAHLAGGPLDGQIIPLEEGAVDELVLPYSEGQLVYRLVSVSDGSDGPVTGSYTFAETSEILVEDQYNQAGDRVQSGVDEQPEA
jgi:hypothetical protein